MNSAIATPSITVVIPWNIAAIAAGNPMFIRVGYTTNVTPIDLRSIPLAPGEEQKLLDKLGQGEVHAQLSALGSSNFVETRYPGVWVVEHFNSNDEVIGKFIEVCDIPDLLRSQQDDIREGLEQLQTQLA